MKQINPEYIESVDYKYMQEAPVEWRDEKKHWLLGKFEAGWYLGTRESLAYAGFNAESGLWIGKDSLREGFNLEQRYIMSEGKPFLKPYVDIKMFSGDSERVYFETDHKLRAFLISIKAERFFTLPN